MLVGGSNHFPKFGKLFENYTYLIINKMERLPMFDKKVVLNWSCAKLILHQIAKTLFIRLKLWIHAWPMLKVKLWSLIINDNLWGWSAMYIFTGLCFLVWSIYWSDIICFVCYI